MGTGSGASILVLAGTVASGFFIFSATRAMKMKDDGRPLAEFMWFAAGLLPLAGVCLLWASMGDQPVTPQRVFLFIIGALIGGFGLLAVGELIRPTAPAIAGGVRIVKEAQAMPDQSGVPPINQNITTYNQSGGNNTNIVNVNPRIKRTMDANMKAGFLKDLPKDRPVLVMGMNGNTESMSFANEIFSFLKTNGYPVKNDSATWHMFFDPPVFNVRISPGGGKDGKEWWIIVGPAE